MSRPSKRVSIGPMGVASDGGIIVNAHALTNKDGLDAVVEIATKSGLGLFVGVVVPPRVHRRLLRDIDDATADVVGRLGPRLVKGGGRR